MRFTAVYVNGDSGWIVAFVEEFPNIVTQGKTIEEARDRVIDAVRIMLEIGREECAESTSDRPILLRETLSADPAEPAN